MSTAISLRRFGTTSYENVCNRCAHVVYSAEKIGPLKDFTFYHHNCFKCHVCGTKLTLKTYFNNQQDQDDKQVHSIFYTYLFRSKFIQIFNYLSFLAFFTFKSIQTKI